MTVLVSLSITYKRTMTDWNTLKNTERTDRPSRVLRLRQNWISESYITQSSSSSPNFITQFHHRVRTISWLTLEGAY